MVTASHLNYFELPPPSPKQFRVTDLSFGGKDAILVYPFVGKPDWEQTSVWLRSSIWDKQTGEALSLGFPKFYNLTENGTSLPPLDQIGFVEKIDGSLAIVDYLESNEGNKVNWRPRGSPSFQKVGNYHEIRALQDRYPGAAQLAQAFSDSSILFEIVSPTVRIVLEYPEPELYLIGKIHRTTGVLTKQAELDQLAQQYQLRRPATVTFPHTTAAEVLETINNMEHEGYCAYSQDGHSIIKLKTQKYRQSHSFKSHCTPQQIVVWYIEAYQQGKPNPVKSILEDIENRLSWECADIARPILERIDTCFQPIAERIHLAKELALECRNLSAKEFAAYLINYPHLKSYAFQFFHGKPIEASSLRKELETALKNHTI